MREAHTPATPETPEAFARRDFLRQLALGSAAAGLAVSGTAAAAPLPSEPAALATPPQGYHESEHIRAYYATCR